MSNIVEKFLPFRQNSTWTGYFKGLYNDCIDRQKPISVQTGRRRYEQISQRKTDYSISRFTAKETAIYLLQSIFIMGAVNYLFFENLWAFLPLLVFPPFYLKWKKKEQIRKRKKRLAETFRDALNAMNTAVQAGYSAENAVRMALKDLERLYRTDEDIVKEFRFMDYQMQVNIPLERLFLDFGERSGIEDIENFAAVFLTLKRTGGDLPEILQKTARMLSDKIDVKREIETVLAAKKMEQFVMSLMPAGIVLYLKLISPGFLDVVYRNIPGTFFMSVCLAVYALAFCLGRRIVDIEV